MNKSYFSNKINFVKITSRYTVFIQFNQTVPSWNLIRRDEFELCKKYVCSL